MKSVGYKSPPTRLKGNIQYRLTKGNSMPIQKSVWILVYHSNGDHNTNKPKTLNKPATSEGIKLYKKLFNTATEKGDQNDKP